MSCSIFILFFFSLLLILDSAALIALESCPHFCGQTEIPFPFGVGEGCSLENGYDIECQNHAGKHVPILGVSSIEVVKISLPGYEYSDYESWLQASIIIRSSNDATMFLDATIHVFSYF